MAGSGSCLQSDYGNAPAVGRNSLSTFFGPEPAGKRARATVLRYLDKPMSQPFTERLIAFQSNVLPDLLARLAEQLGVSEKALTAMEIGYALRIPMKENKEVRNCWVFAERDDAGTIVGLSLRNWKGDKFMVPGSKRGLIFIPNLQPGPVGKSYQSGPQNWLRTSDDVACPICGKHDWCLVSAENPEDPKAVLCSRIEEGSEKHIPDTGYLHIRKDEGVLAGEGTTLPPSEAPILVVEGASDVAAAYDLGLVAVGRPSSAGGLKQLAMLVAGRQVIIVGENDAKAGKEGMEKTFENIKGSVKRAIKLLPPEGIKDLRAWVRRGLTAEQLLALAKTAGVTTSNERLLESIAPMDLATHWLDKFYRVGETRTLVFLHQTWYHFTGDCYQAMSYEALRSHLYTYFGDKQYRKMRANGFDIMDFEPNKRKIDEIIDAVKALAASGSPDIPYYRGPSAFDPILTLSFPNGQIHVEEYLQNRPILHPTDPLLFTLNCYPYDFTPVAGCPRWKRFLKEVFPRDERKRLLLQEWFGYNLIPDNSQEKFMMMLGPTRAGKSTVIDVLTGVLGERQVIATSLRQITNRFSLYPFFGKYSATIGDVSIGRNYDATEALNVLKRISGNDRVTIERKNRDIEQSNVKLYTRFTMASNSMPQLPDYARTIESRMLLLRFPISFMGREELTLKADLQKESPGILLWALEGLKRLRTQNGFTLPETHATDLETIRSGLTPLQDFVDECCEVGRSPGYYASTTALYECWRQWALAQGEKLYSAGWLFRKLDELHRCFKYRLTVEGGRVRVIRGIKLNVKSRKRFGR